MTEEQVEALNKKHYGELQAALDALQPEQDFVEPQPEPPPPGAASRVETGVPLDQLQALNASLLTLPVRLHDAPQARARAREAAHGARTSPTSARWTGRWPRNWRYASILARRARASASPARTSSAARSAIATPCSTTSNTGRVHVPLQVAAAGEGRLRDPQQPADRERRDRLRVRLQHPGAVAAGDLGSAVRRLHQRRAGDDRRVHRLGARQVGAASVAGAAAAARARRAGPGSRERAARAVPAARRRPEHARRQLHDRGAVLPPAAPAGRRC